MELILVRHGTVPGNLEHRFIGVTDQPLTEEGKELAARRAKVIPSVEHVFSSPLQRCLQTAEVLWPGVPCTVIPELRETDFGKFECKCHAELLEDKDYLLWLESGGKTELLGSETREQCIARAENALRKIIKICKAQNLDRVGISTHGGTIMDLLWRFARPERDYYDWKPPNCGGWIVSVGEANLTLEVLDVLEDLTDTK